MNTSVPSTSFDSLPVSRGAFARDLTRPRGPRAGAAEGRRRERVSRPPPRPERVNAEAEPHRKARAITTLQAGVNGGGKLHFDQYVTQVAEVRGEPELQISNEAGGPLNDVLNIQ